MIDAIRAYAAYRPGLVWGGLLFLLLLGLLIGAQHLYWEISGATDPRSFQ